MPENMEITSKPQWELYTDEELVPGAKRWGLTVAQERERVRLLQSDFSQWPSDLKSFLQKINPGDYPGVPTSSFDVIQYGLVSWLKTRKPSPVATALAA